MAFAGQSDRHWASIFEILFVLVTPDSSAIQVLDRPIVLKVFNMDDNLRAITLVNLAAVLVELTMNVCRCRSRSRQHSYCHYLFTSGMKTEWMTNPQSEKCVRPCKAIQFWLKFASL